MTRSAPPAVAFKVLAGVVVCPALGTGLPEIHQLYEPVVRWQQEPRKCHTAKTRRGQSDYKPIHVRVIPSVYSIA